MKANKRWSEKRANMKIQPNCARNTLGTNRIKQPNKSFHYCVIIALGMGRYMVHRQMIIHGNKINKPFILLGFSTYSSPKKCVHNTHFSKYLSYNEADIIVG